MSLIDKISEEIKVAMKARNALRLEALRSVKKELIEAKTSGKSGGEISQDDELKLLQRMVKQRKDSANIYSAQGRADLYDKEVAEAEIISEFLPEQISPEELEKVVEEIIKEVGAESVKDMGKVMGVATKKLAGKADGKDVSNTVKRLLAGA
ncbi:GatB/YqeY domain-containing protein [Marinilabilia salmonicolor]|uniref:GatB/YqeY domain-containing protein n=1 Tax=Marinilabilia salmonicolor TaxID=989 RepID=UPI00029A4FE3|nr:GatB/YqeY domain-containing protein [Marinilabilia salmonicolor]